ncbi:MAG: winged helix-turn-helix transcriptional regulator [Candidatus Thorarchaeota archaeon]|nr:winged helix-turn-helix transcriptional regulator [Candidatus Thorarchaeota archaeon]
MGRQKRMALLLHPFRRDLYQVLCENPGTYLLELVEMLESPLGTLTWHLRILEREGLVKSIKFAGKRLYYPRMLRSQEAEMAYLTMRSDTAKQIFAYVVNNPGCYQEEMAATLGVHHDTVRWHVSRMEEVGLIRVERDGRKKKHFLDELGQSLMAGSLNTISEAYVMFLMEKLEDGCLNPEIREATDDHVTIRIDCPERGKDCYITINLREWEFQFFEEEEDEESDASEE